jgi:hypothetical protein
MPQIDRLLTGGVCAALLLCAAAAEAQFQYRPVSTRDPATGENYHVEVSGDFWFSTPAILVSSEALGIVGTQIDAVSDLGFAKKRFPEFRLVLRPATKHKWRLQYIPINFSSEAVLNRNIVFNGIRYDVGLPVNSSLDWKAWRFGYEYDFIYRDRGFVGLLVEAKYTDVQVNLDSVVGSEFTHARAPIPAIGGIGRIYVVPNISVTFEMSGFKLPESIDDEWRGRYLDFDLYGTVNFTDNVGVQIGYRSLDVFYQIDSDTGDFDLKGTYFGAVARF